MGLFAFLKNKFQPKEAEKYDKGLSKSRASFGDKLAQLAKRYSLVNADYFEELEQILIEADVGVSLSLRLIEELLTKSQKEKLTDPAAINEALVDMMFVGYVTEGQDIENEVRFAKEGPTVLLVVGVNGVGKTTTIAKLASRYQALGKKAMQADEYFVVGDNRRLGASDDSRKYGPLGIRHRSNSAYPLGKDLLGGRAVAVTAKRSVIVKSNGTIVNHWLFGSTLLPWQIKYLGPDGEAANTLAVTSASVSDLALFSFARRRLWR